MSTPLLRLYCRPTRGRGTNVVDERPAEDGIYEQTLEIGGGSLVVSGSPTLVSSDFTQPSLEDPTPGCPPGEIDPNNAACKEPLDISP